MSVSKKSECSSTSSINGSSSDDLGKDRSKTRKAKLLEPLRGFQAISSLDKKLLSGLFDSDMRKQGDLRMQEEQSVRAR